MYMLASRLFTRLMISRRECQPGSADRGCRPKQPAGPLITLRWPSGSFCAFWGICERVDNSAGTTPFKTTFCDQAAAHQIKALAFAFIGEK